MNVITMRSVWFSFLLLLNTLLISCVLHIFLCCDTTLMFFLSQIAEEIAAASIQIYILPDCDDDEDIEYKEQCRQLRVIPFAQLFCFG